MYSSKASVMLLGSKKQNFNDSVMVKIDVYSDGDVDSFFVAENNPILSSLAKVKPTDMITIQMSWNKVDKAYKHRLISLVPGI